MKRILITGGAGYIGDSTVHFLNNIGVKSTVLDNLVYGGSYMRPVEFIRMNITNHKALEELIRERDFDSVIHLASIVGDGACAVNQENTIAVNEEATKVLADICQDTNTRLVFASTCSVYGANNDLLDEESPTNPLSLYAGTKLNAENYIRENVEDHIIFRLGTLFGMSTEHARIRCDLVANILTYKAALGQKLTVFGGSQWRPLLHVQDAGLAFANAANAAYDRFIPGTYILSRENITIGDLADLIVEEVGQGEVVQVESKFEDLRNYRVNNDKASKAHFFSAYDLRTGIAEMAKVMREGRIANVWSSEFHNAKFTKENHD